MKIELSAQIIPCKGGGGIQLNTPITAYAELLADDSTGGYLADRLYLCYHVGGCMDLWFHVLSQKLFKMTFYAGYRGRLFGAIALGDEIKTAMRQDTSLRFDELEQAYVSAKGACLTADPDSGKILSISIFTPETIGIPSGRET